MAAAAAIKNGDIVAYPTEGVFGLGCDPANIEAVTQLVALKKRDADKGLILIASNREQLTPYIGTLTAAIEQKLADTWPGPVTWILPCRENTPSLLSGGRPTIATRITSHPPAALLCEQCDHALVSTSANQSGQPACTSAQQVESLFGEKVSYTLRLPVGDLTGPTPIFDGVSGKQLR